MPMTERPNFLIVITGWNWERYVTSCLNSVLAQTYKKYDVSIIDDGSTDASMLMLSSYCEHGFKIDFSDKNEGTIFARNKAISQFDGYYDVIVFLDGDDQLTSNALEVLAEQYMTKDILITYGNWMNQDRKVCPMPLKYEKVVHNTRDYRKDTFRLTHLRSFKKELYYKINWWKFTQSEIESYPDVELLFQMAEMCGEKRIGVIYEPIYIYNETNPDRTLTRFGKDDAGYAEICNRPKRELI